MRFEKFVDYDKQPLLQDSTVIIRTGNIQRSIWFPYFVRARKLQILLKRLMSSIIYRKLNAVIRNKSYTDQIKQRDTIHHVEGVMFRTIGQ